jgi:tRNA(Ile)-lysidine synthase
MITLFQDFILTHHLLQKGDVVLLAISGGIDSVVLAQLLFEANIPFALGHCNFKLRDEASDADEQFVIDLAAFYKVPVHTTQFDTLAYAKKHQQSVQLAARNLRYTWLESIRQMHKYTFIATAHQANDVAETMLYNLSKGTGIAGLHGILPKKGKIIRPMLFASKTEVWQYAEHKQLQWREDASNQSLKYTRNKIRHEVIPVLESINPKLAHTFFDNAQRFREVELIYQQGIAYYRSKLMQTGRLESLIPINKLLGLPALKTILYELLKPYNFNTTQVQQIIDGLQGESGRLYFSTTHQILRNRKFLVLSEKTTKDVSYTLINATQTIVEKKDMVLHLNTIDSKDFIIPTAPNWACFDANKVRYPLLLRRWKEGDYFYPFGMKMKKKKLKRFFGDIKLSRTEKERVWVLTDDNERIIWLVGLRTDERFKVHPKTTTVLQIQCKTKV